MHLNVDLIIVKSEMYIWGFNVRSLTHLCYVRSAMSQLLLGFH